MIPQSINRTSINLTGDWCTCYTEWRSEEPVRGDQCWF